MENIEENTEETASPKMIFSSPPLCSKVVQSLRRTRQVTKSDDPEIFRDLAKHKEWYQQLFLTLTEGHLVEHPAHFFYLDDDRGEDQSAELNKRRKAFAVLCFLIFRDLESEQGGENRFWADPEEIVNHFYKIDELPHHTSAPDKKLMQQLNIHTREDTLEVLTAMQHIRFIRFSEDKQGFWFLTPIMRLVDAAQTMSSNEFRQKISEVPA